MLIGLSGIGPWSQYAKTSNSSKQLPQEQNVDIIDHILCLQLRGKFLQTTKWTIILEYHSNRYSTKTWKNLHNTAALNGDSIKRLVRLIKH